MNDDIKGLKADKVLKGISLITAVKNREKHLEESLKSWILMDEINEIIIVDWSSKNSLVPLIEKYQNGKIKLVIVIEQEFWVLSEAYNVAARFALFNKILKVDSDVLLYNNFFENHKLSEGTFYAGNWENAKNENETHLNGCLYVYKEDFFKVNGYNEHIKSYGWDDSDLYIRLQDINLVKKDLNFSFLHHIEHNERMKHQAKPDDFIEMSDDELIRYNLHFNKRLSELTNTWSNKNIHSQFEIVRTINSTFYCKKLNNEDLSLPSNVLQKAKVKAIIDRLFENKIVIPNEKSLDIKYKEFQELYNIYLKKNNSAEDETIFNLLKKLISFGNIKSNLILTLETNLAKNTQLINESKIELEENAIKILEKDIQLNKFIENLKTKESIINEKNIQINQFIENLKTKESIINEKNIQLNKFIENLKTKENIINDRNIQLNQLVEKLKAKEDENERIKINLLDSNIQVENLNKSLISRDLEIRNYKNSFFYKTISGIKKIVLNRFTLWLYHLISKDIIIRKECKFLENSELFNSEYYLKNNPDLKNSKIKLSKHYLLIGGFENRNPSSDFNSKQYLDENPDVKKAGINPLLHYLLYGKNEKR